MWKGTVGAAPVMVCFTAYGEAQTYYLRHRRGIRLAPPGGSGPTPEGWAESWGRGPVELEELLLDDNRERRITGLWRLSQKSPAEISGQWTGPSGGSPTPIKLTRVPTGESNEVCAAPFYEPIRAAVKPQTAPARFGNRAYDELSSDQGTSFKVPPDTPHAERLNRHALDWLRDQSVVAFECDLNRGGGPAALGSSLKPEVWTDRHLVMQDLLPETYCGGAHGNWSISYSTWSFQQGKLIDTWRWLRGGDKALVAHTSRGGKTIASGLFRLIRNAHPRNTPGDDCSQNLDWMSVNPPYPKADGLVFPTGFSHAMRACGDEVVLSWKQLAPYLSVEGMALMESGP